MYIEKTKLEQDSKLLKNNKMGSKPQEKQLEKLHPNLYPSKKAQILSK